MSFASVVFGQDIVLDEEAFQQAIQDFNGLNKQLQQLRNDIEEMLDDLKTGFDTPAGRQFIASCRDNLLKPLDDQKLVLDHISETLEQSERAYRPVFDEYEALNNAIKGI